MPAHCLVFHRQYRQLEDMIPLITVDSFDRAIRSFDKGDPVLEPIGVGTLPLERRRTEQNSPNLHTLLLVNRSLAGVREEETKGVFIHPFERELVIWRSELGFELSNVCLLLGDCGAIGIRPSFDETVLFDLAHGRRGHNGGGNQRRDITEINSDIRKILLRGLNIHVIAIMAIAPIFLIDGV